MDKPTPREVTEATDEQLIEWAAIYVMEWVKKILVERHYENFKVGVWHNLEGYWQANVNDWNPLKDYNHAWMLVEKLKESKKRIDLRWQKFIGWSVEIEELQNGNDELELPRATTIAAILAQLGLKEG